jgi:hypothetical protein
MTSTPLENADTTVGVGGDFARVFDHEDYLTMFNSLDEVSVVLRAHMILEEFLNIWCSRITNTEDLFLGAFFPFKTKLVIAKNLGLSADYEIILNKFNDIRNSYSHKRKYILEASRLELIKNKVNALNSEKPMLPCEQFYIEASGTDQLGQRKEVKLEWSTMDTKKRVLLIFIQLVMKFVQWMQQEFIRRGIAYNLVVWGSTLNENS